MVTELRKKTVYRLAEMFLGGFSIFFLMMVFIGALFFPQASAIFLIVYGFLWILKVAVHCIHTIFTYKRLTRWEAFDWKLWLSEMRRNQDDGLQLLEEFGDRFSGAIDWKQDMDIAIKNIKQSNISVDEVYHIPVFPVYEESSETIIQSLERIHQSGYDLENVLVVISQEERVDTDFNNSVIADIKKLSWSHVLVHSESDLETVYAKKYDKLTYTSAKMKRFKLSEKKLNILITQHPDGLIGEIKGKASNEDWGARQAALYCKVHGLDTEKIIVTSLDADSRPDSAFFQKLTFKYLSVKDRTYTGYHHVPVYSNNFFNSDTIPRIIATQTTLWNLVQASLVQELTFFSTYSLPLSVLEKVDFWMRDVIAEDFMLFAKCLNQTKGRFKVVPAYGVFEGDVVEAEDFLQAIINQYKQLQRWAWGGVEAIPFLFYIFFVDPKGEKIDMRLRIRHLANQFFNHFFWATPPFVFSFGVLLPGLFQGDAFYRTTAAQNLGSFSEYYAWTSYIFLLVFGYITFQYIAARAVDTSRKPMTALDYISVFVQFLISPLIYGFMGLPAIDAQIRGMLGKYLGYWVTPKN